mmetsp:Transcript_27604/g.65493  ORF Transcript_27604/g.65493 Transcript_27604/m.65493 type:complete len:215 (+) Transcript_27604:241-885(+)
MGEVWLIRAAKQLPASANGQSLWPKAVGSVAGGFLSRAGSKGADPVPGTQRGGSSPAELERGRAEGPPAQGAWFPGQADRDRAREARRHLPPGDSDPGVAHPGSRGGDGAPPARLPRPLELRRPPFPARVCRGVDPPPRRPAASARGACGGPRGARLRGPRPGRGAGGPLCGVRLRTQLWIGTQAPRDPHQALGRGVGNHARDAPVQEARRPGR